MATPYRATPLHTDTAIPAAEPLAWALLLASDPKGFAPPVAPGVAVEPLPPEPPLAPVTRGLDPSIGCPAISGMAGLMKDMSVRMVTSGCLYNGEFGVCKSTPS